MWYTRTRNAEDIANDLLAAAVNGGGTVSPREGQALPTRGYCVGQRGISGTLHYFEVLDWVTRELTGVAGGGLFFGAWLDGPTGVLYLDVVKIHTELVPACRDAAARGELAIYDLGGQREIRAEDYVTAPGVQL
jgi:hypothetical protein